MPELSAIQAALVKAGAPQSLVKQVDSMTKAIDDALEQQTFQQTSTAKKQFSSIYVLSKILNVEEKPTKGVNNTPGLMCKILAMTLSTGDAPIKADAGRRDEKGKVYVKILKDQVMTQKQQEEYAAANEGKAKGKGGAMKKKIVWKAGELPINKIMRYVIFEGTPIHPTKGSKFKKGDIVMIAGPQPRQSYKANDDATVHDPSFGTQWTFSELVPDPRENDPTAPVHKAGDWALEMECNYIVNFSKHPPPRGGWALENMSDEDRAKVAEWEEKNTLDANRFELARMGLTPEGRDNMDGFVVIPLHYTAKADQPFHKAKRKFVKFEGVAWGDVWFEQFKGVGNVDQEAASAQLQCVAKVVEVVSTTEQKIQKAQVQLQLNARYDADGINQYGIVKLNRWKNLAPVIIPYVSGYVIGTLAAAQSEMLPANQPMRNPIKPNGETVLGIDYAIQCYQFYHQPDLSTIITSPTAFQINLDCVKVLMRNALNYDDPSAVSLPEDIRNNPLNSGTRNVINLFETTERPDNLDRDYNFYLIYATDESAFTSIESTRADLAAAKLDPVDTWSKIFSAPSKIKDPAKELFKLNSLPKPDFGNRANADKFCVFAVRKTEVAKVNEGPAAFEMPLTDFVARMMELNEEETKKYGPLPEGSPVDNNEPSKRGVESSSSAAPAGDSAAATAAAAPKKASTAKKGGRKGRGASSAAAAATASQADDTGEGGASQSQADQDFYEQ